MRDVVVVTAPGKVMLAGEWAVLERGNSALVLSMDKGVTVTLQQSNNFSFDIPIIGIQGIKAEFYGKSLRILTKLSHEQEIQFSFVHYATLFALYYLQENGIAITPFHLSIHSKISSISGLGSSAATVVGIVKGILSFHGVDVTCEEEKEIAFKISCIAHYEAQGKQGSCFDVAAATYQEPLIYRRFDPDWLEYSYKKNKNITAVVEQMWPYLEIEPIQLCPMMHVCVGFVGYGARTSELIQKMKQFKKHEEHFYKRASDLLAGIVEQLIDAINRHDTQKILKLIKQNRNALKSLTDYSGLLLETPELGLLCDIAEQYGGAAKLSGAGGGDCGIAVCFDEKTAKNIMEAWRIHRIEPVACLRF